MQAQNALFSAGQIGQQPTQAPVELSFPVVTQRPFIDPLQYENMILRASSTGSAIVRLKDVARAEVGLKSYIVDAKLNGVPATYIAIYQQAGVECARRIGRRAQGTRRDAGATLPPGIETVVALDTTDFVRLSIEEVIHTLFEAHRTGRAGRVLFLQSLRATFICIIAVFVALVGAFSGMFALGYSLNLLTLFGLVLAIGMVVDDAIVVVENTDRNMHEHGLAPKEAAIRSMQEVSGPVVAVVLVLCAVFIPAAFLPGSTGQFYKQFAITIVVSVAISGLRRADADARDVRAAAEARGAEDEGLLRLVQPAVPEADRCLRPARDADDPPLGDRARSCSPVSSARSCCCSARRRPASCRWRTRAMCWPRS